MKKRPFFLYQKETGRKPFIGIMAFESRLRTTNYCQRGCNFYEGKSLRSTPLGFWVDNDIWEYININNLKYSNIYNMGYNRTGCMFCMFGVEQEGTPNRFQRMKQTHPKLYDYCINVLGCGNVLDLLGVNYIDIQLELKL